MKVWRSFLHKESRKRANLLGAVAFGTNLKRVCFQSVGATMEVLPVVRQLRDLAADPVNRAVIVKDQSCLQSLVLFLDNKDDEVVSTSLQALKHLAQYPGNRPTMRSELGMLQSLKAIVDRKENSSCSHMAQEIYHLLLPSAQPTSKVQQPTMAGGSFFKSGYMKNARTITLQIYGLSDMSSRKQLEDELLHVSGVVSFTFNMVRQRCIIRCKADLKPAALCHAVANTGYMSAKQVVKKDNGEETLVAFDESPVAMKSPEKKEDMPDYLPEDDEYPEVSDKAVARTGVDDGSGGWFGSVSSFISKTLYW